MPRPGKPQWQLQFVQNDRVRRRIRHARRQRLMFNEYGLQQFDHGLGQEEAVALIVNGFAKEVLQQLPMEFAVEAQKLLGISLEGSVG